MTAKSRQITIHVPAEATVEQQWMRYPKPGESDQRTGLNRQAIYRLVKAGVVEQRVVRTGAHQKHGIPLINVESLLRAIQAGGVPAASGD